jgi:hypothetical protein
MFDFGTWCPVTQLQIQRERRSLFTSVIREVVVKFGHLAAISFAVVE